MCYIFNYFLYVVNHIIIDLYTPAWFYPPDEGQRKIPETVFTNVVNTFNTLPLNSPVRKSFVKDLFVGLNGPEVEIALGIDKSTVTRV